LRFIHTADWHLGKRLHDFPLHEVQKELIESFVRLVNDVEPDAVIVAGDVFDTHVPQLTALELWENAVESIVAEAGVPMLVIPGNHDHPDRMSAHHGIAKRAGLHLVRSLAECPTPVTIANVDIYGVPFHKPVHVNAAYRDEPPGVGDFDYGSAMACVLARLNRAAGRPAVLVAHAFVEGSGDEPDGEDAIMVGGAGGVPVSSFDGYAYVALGHIHGPRRLGKTGEVHYSGSLFPYSFREAVSSELDGVVAPGDGAKGVNVVEVRSDGAVEREFVALAASRRVQVIEGLTFDELIKRARTLDSRERLHYTLARITDQGPVQNAIAKLREVLPNAVLEQPNVSVAETVARLRGDHRTITPQDALRQLYAQVYDEAMSPLELEILDEVVGDDQEEAAA